MATTHDEQQFTSMESATPEQMANIMRLADEHLVSKVADTLLQLLDDHRGMNVGYRVDRYEHSLQTATRALRDGARSDLVVAALLHDIGDGLSPANHSEVAAAILAPYLDAEATWIVRHHGVFQGYHYFHKIGKDRNERDRYAGNPHFDACAHFCAAWDQEAFDPDYDTLPLEAFMPMVNEVFSRTPFGHAEMARA